MVCVCVSVKIPRVLTSEPSYVREGSVHPSGALISPFTLVSCNPVHVNVQNVINSHI